MTFVNRGNSICISFLHKADYAESDGTKDLIMGLLSRILGLFAGDNAEGQLNKGLELARAGKPDAAIRIYDGLLEAATDADLRARVLLNRALAYHAMSDDAQAEHDLKLVLASHQATENVRATAREKLARVQKRMLRTSDRANR